MGTRITVSLTVYLTLVFASGCALPRETGNNDGEIITSVRSVLETQQAAWNRGDIDGFMDGYDRAGTTAFVSGDELTRGWQTVLDRYKQHYKTREDMGTLAFSELAIQAVHRDLAIADGRWQLIRAGDRPHGRFTLLFQRTNGSWRIIHDTTTSATP
jgi:ketosteroid isomerase-like protein